MNGKLSLICTNMKRQLYRKGVFVLKVDWDHCVELLETYILVRCRESSL
jgi:hypothetical protein